VASIVNFLFGGAKFYLDAYSTDPHSRPGIFIGWGAIAPVAPRIDTHSPFGSTPLGKKREHETGRERKEGWNGWLDEGKVVFKRRRESRQIVGLVLRCRTKGAITGK